MKIGIIGLGLIGGSILKALQNKGHELFAVSKSSFKAAQTLATTGNNFDLMRGCEVIFVCPKISETLLILDALKGIVAEDTIVCDVASLKGFVSKKKYPYHFIGTHPMAGTEFSGFEASFGELFVGAKWVITEKNEKVETLIKQMGATPVLAKPEEHDLAAAQISHIPTLLAFALTKSIQNNKLAQTLAASSFRDATRVALTSADLAADMVQLNAKNVQAGLELLINELNCLKNLPYNEMISEFTKISRIRKNLYDKNGKNSTIL